MPRIELISVPRYNPLDPYHFEYDNIPIDALVARQELINDAVESNRQIITEAIGTQGTLSNRLSQSIEDDGSLKSVAIDDAQHSIEAHSDTEDYVRMTSAERDKLNLIADEATNVSLTFSLGGDTDVSFDDGEIIFEDTASVTWDVISPNKIQANLGFPVAAAHRHLYDVEPVTTNYVDYTLPTPFIEGSLRVYVNGIRLSQYEETYVPDATTNNEFLIQYTADDLDGSFALSAAIDDDDVIRVDYDISFL